VFTGRESPEGERCRIDVDDDHHSIQWTPNTTSPSRHPRSGWPTRQRQVERGLDQQPTRSVTLAVVNSAAQRSPASAQASRDGHRAVQQAVADEPRPSRAWASSTRVEVAATQVMLSSTINQASVAQPVPEQGNAGRPLSRRTARSGPAARTVPGATRRRPRPGTSRRGAAKARASRAGGSAQQYRAQRSGQSGAGRSVPAVRCRPVRCRTVRGPRSRLRSRRPLPGGRNRPGSSASSNRADRNEAPRPAGTWKAPRGVKETARPARRSWSCATGRAA